MKTAALGIVLLLLIGTVPASNAQGWLDQWRQRREHWAERIENYKNKLAQWHEALAEFHQAKAQYLRGEITLKELRAKAAEVARLAFELRLTYLLRLEANIEAARGVAENEREALLAEIRTYIDTLKSYGENIQGAATWREKREIVRELRDYWFSIRARLKQITAQLIVARFQAVIERAGAFAAKLEARIAELKENGVDTSKLENWLGRFKDSISYARDLLENAGSLIPEIADSVAFRQIFRNFVAKMRSVLTYLREAFRSLRELFREIRGGVVLSGSGTLIAKGSGTVKIALTGTLMVTSIENGEMRVFPKTGVIRVEGGDREELENGEMLYTGFSYAHLAGENISVVLSGSEIELKASGTGTVILQGSGWFKTFGEIEYRFENWSADGVQVSLASGMRR